MKKIFYVALITAISFTACSKDKLSPALQQTTVPNTVLVVPMFERQHPSLINGQTKMFNTGW